MSDRLLHRVVKNGMALAGSQGIHLFNQLLLPPAFIAAYGTQGYGEWLVLSAAIGFLTSLDFGLQTYVLNELTGHYHRGEMDKFHRLQSVASRMIVVIVAVTAVLALLVFVAPIGQILRVSVPELEVSLTVYLLALQILLGIVFGQFVGIFRTFGKAHRGAMWSNAQKAALLLVTVALTLTHAPFWGIALGQLLTLPVAILISLIDLKRVAPTVFPRLDYWDGRLARTVLAPSAFFGLFTLNNFIVFQAPLLILNHLLGAQAVVVFSVGRTLFSFVRQGVTSVQHAIAPEIARLYGIGDSAKLVRLYRLSESIALSLTLVLNVGTYLLAPILLWAWLHRPELFKPEEYALLMAVAVLMSVKDYKLYFLYATNNHVKPAIAMFIAYVLFCAVGIPATSGFGLSGLLVVWTLAELAQVGVVHVFNKKILPATQVGLGPAFRLGLVLLVVALFLQYFEPVAIPDGFLLQAAEAVFVMLALALLSYYLFSLREFFGAWRDRVAGS